MTQRWKLLIEYDGTNFCGWQKQDNAPSVQEVLEEAIYQMSGERVNCVAAGRTDSGVHALGQVVHFDLEKEMGAERVMPAINFYLNEMECRETIVLSAEAVNEAFHARFSAKQRSYFYRILYRPAKAVIDHKRVWWIKHDLDMEAMNEGAQHLIGHHDYSSFRTVFCQAKSPVKSIDEIFFEERQVLHGGREIIMHIKARSFLHHQVRNIIGTLKLVGEGKYPPEHVKEILEARDRSVAGPTAPPDGLYFKQVWY